MLTSGPHGSADWFDCSIRSLTVNVGRGNSGADGLHFFSNNERCLRDVTIRSEDGQGQTGLDLGYNDMNGPLLVKNLAVLGFAVGIHTGFTVNSQTLEHVRVEGQSRAGFQNDGQEVSLRDMRSVNAVPAVINNSGLLCLTGASLRGTGAARGTAAVRNGGGLYARDVRTTGYRTAMDGVAGTTVAEYASRPAITLFPSPPHGLDLPAPETPEVPWDDPKTWDSPTHHGAVPGSDADISAALQAAIDSGATTVYVPTGDWHIGHTIHVRGNVRRLIGMDSYIVPSEPLNSQDAPLFQFDGGRQQTVVMERWDFGFGNKKLYGWQDNSPQTVVLRDCLGYDYRNGPKAGPLFIEDVVAGRFFFRRQRVWARQLNQESEGLHVANDGGTLWILGLKTERGGTLVETMRRGRTEVLGGLCYTTTAGKLAPMFVNDNSSMSVTLGERCYNGDPYVTILRETRGGRTRTMDHTDRRYGGQIVLYAGAAGLTERSSAGIGPAPHPGSSAPPVRPGTGSVPRPGP